MLACSDCECCSFCSDSLGAGFNPPIYTFKHGFNLPFFIVEQGFDILVFLYGLGGCLALAVLSERDWITVPKNVREKLAKECTEV